MKNLLLLLSLVLATSQVKSQVLTMTVDTVQLFMFESSIEPDKAIKEKLIKYDGSRTYTTKGNKWTLNKSKGYVNFGSNDCKIVRVEGDKLVYLSGNQEYRIFLMKECETGRDMVFFLEPEKDGMVRGGFGYPKNIKTKQKKGVK